MPSTMNCRYRLGSSFSSEAEPLTIEVEGQTVRLTGSAEQQYATWRSMLKQIYAQETGLIGEFETLPELDQSSPQEMNEQQQPAPE